MFPDSSHCKKYNGSFVYLIEMLRKLQMRCKVTYLNFDDVFCLTENVIKYVTEILTV